jgi:hypothetical protein
MFERMLGEIVPPGTPGEEGLQCRAGVQACLACEAAARLLASLSPGLHAQNRALKTYLRTHLYQHHRIERMKDKASRVLQALCERYLENPRLLPDDARKRAALVRVELGDARVRLEAVKRERPGERYDLIVVDAFTSDAIPVHLLTREALRLYVEMLAPDGLLALHLSNRYLRLEPVVANLAADAGLGGRLVQHDDAPETEGATRSTWAVLARMPEALGDLAHDARWTTATLEPDPQVGTWTDDFHNLFSVFKW